MTTNKEKLSSDQKIQCNEIARKRAKDFVSKYEFQNLNSLKILEEFYILKFPNDLGISGAYIEKKGRDKLYKCIYINSGEPIGRQNFSLLHELYHALYEKSNELVSLEKATSYDKIECTAECFASYVLIRRELLIEELNKIKSFRSTYNININDLLKLQYKFQCSFISLVYAISSLKNINHNLVPKNINYYWQYRKENRWVELEKLTDEFNLLNHQKINLNKPDYSQTWPKRLKENIYQNIENNLISEDEVSDLIEFFEEE